MQELVTEFPIPAGKPRCYWCKVEAGGVHDGCSRDGTVV